jgi:hypothetical protein
MSRIGGPYTPNSSQNKPAKETPSNKATVTRQRARHSRDVSDVDITNLRKRVFKEKATEFVNLLAAENADARKLAGKFDKLCSQVDTGAIDSAYFVDQLTLSIRALPSEKERNAAGNMLGWVASHEMTDGAAKLLRELRPAVDKIPK